MNTERGNIPFRINVKGVTVESFEQLYYNIEMNKGLDFITPKDAHSGKLAIVGGGSSLSNNIIDLKEWNDNIWSINKTHDWLYQHGILSTFVTVDAEPNLKFYPSREHVNNSLFASHCDPVLVRSYRNAKLFHMSPLVVSGVHGGSSTAVSMAFVALSMGYRDITFYGCESSLGNTSHIDRNDDLPNQMIIRANGEEFTTTPSLYCQVQELSRLVKFKPEWFKQKCGGLFEAMIKDDNWEIVAVSEQLKFHLEELNGKCGLFDLPYVRKS